MGYLSGLEEYLKKNYYNSVFDTALHSGEPWRYHLHGNRTLTAHLTENSTYDVKLKAEENNEETLPKTAIKLLYLASLKASVRQLLKTAKKVRKLGLEPIIAEAERNHIKNKTLFPLMEEKQVLFFTLLEGEVIRGVIKDFSRYDITIGLKGGIPATIMRHAIHDLRDKKGNCYLKSIQEKRKGWKNSPLYVTSEDP